MRRFEDKSLMKEKCGLSNFVRISILLIFIIASVLGILFVKEILYDNSKPYPLVDIDKQVLVVTQKKLAISSRKIILSPDAVYLNSGNESMIYMGIENCLDGNETFDILGGGMLNSEGVLINNKSTIICFDGNLNNGSEATSDDLKKIIFRTFPKYKINSGKSAIFKVLVKVDPDAPAGLYFCKAVIVDPTNSSKIYGEYPITIDVEKSS